MRRNKGIRYPHAEIYQSLVEDIVFVGIFYIYPQDIID